MTKGLFKIPRYVPSEDVCLNVPVPESRNIHSVPAKQWVKWNTKAREMFNYLYETGMMNPIAVYCTDKFKGGDEVDKIIAAASWNIAWLAADKMSGL